jgi:hypothetical protein
MVHICNPCVRRLRQEDLKFKAYLKKKKTHKKKGRTK